MWLDVKAYWGHILEGSGWGMFHRYPVESDAGYACRVGTGRVTGSWRFRVRIRAKCLNPENGKNGKEPADGPEKKEPK